MHPIQASPEAQSSSPCAAISKHPGPRGRVGLTPQGETQCRCSCNPRISTFTYFVASVHLL